VTFVELVTFLFAQRRQPGHRWKERQYKMQYQEME